MVPGVVHQRWPLSHSHCSLVALLTYLRERHLPPRSRAMASMASMPRRLSAHRGHQRSWRTLVEVLRNSWPSAQRQRSLTPERRLRCDSKAPPRRSAIARTAAIQPSSRRHCLHHVPRRMLRRYDSNRWPRAHSHWSMAVGSTDAGERQRPPYSATRALMSSSEVRQRGHQWPCRIFAAFASHSWPRTQRKRIFSSPRT